MESFNIIVIGAGPSGMMAAWRAAERRRMSPAAMNAAAQTTTSAAHETAAVIQNLGDFEVIDALATLVYNNFRAQFFRQQLRWKKSWIRESLIAATFFWKKPPIAT